MDRLTYYHVGEKGAYMICSGNCRGGLCEECEEFEKIIDRLAAYEDAMPLERAQELAKAEKDGRLVVLEPVPAAKEGAQKPTCFYNDMGQEFCLGFGRGREDDEPIDKCKECWYCEFSLVREEAEAALKNREEADNEAD